MGGSACNPIDLGVIGPGDEVRARNAFGPDEPFSEVPCGGSFIVRWFRLQVAVDTTVEATVCSSVPFFSVFVDGVFVVQSQLLIDILGSESTDWPIVQ